MTLDLSTMVSLATVVVGLLAFMGWRSQVQKDRCAIEMWRHDMTRMTKENRKEIKYLRKRISKKENQSA